MKTGTLVTVIVATLGALASAVYVARYAGAVPAEIPETTTPVEDELAISPTGPHPRAVVDGIKHEFGTMLLGDEKSHTFVIANEGKAPLKLKYTFSTCKCTVPDLKKDEVATVAPGESLDVTLTWTPKENTPEFRQMAEIKTNDPQNETINLEVSGEVDKLLNVVPEGEWDTGVLIEGEPTVVTGTVSSKILDDFQITSIESSNPHVTAEFAPLSDEQRTELGTKAGYEVHVTIAPDVPVGPVDETLTIHTDTEKRPEFTVKVAGKRNGPVRFLPTPGVRWHAREQAISFPRFPAEKGAKARLRMFVDGLADGPLQVSGIETDPEFLKVSLTPQELGEKGNGSYDLTVTVPPGSPPVTRVRKNSGHVLLKTNHPQVPELKLHVEITSY